MIARYLDELDVALRPLPRRLRTRIVAEAEDHLQEATVALLSAEGTPAERVAGRYAAEHAAISAFGPAELVAERFASDLAAEQTARAGWTAAVAAIAFGVFVALGPKGAGAFFAVQFAFVGGLVTLIRLLRGGSPRALRRSATLAVGAAGIGLATAPSLAGAAIGALVLFAIGRLIAAGRPLAAAAPTLEPTLLEDVRQLVPWAPLPRTLGFPAAALAAAGCGALVAAAQFTDDGLAPRAVLAGTLVFAIEASAVLVGFVTLRRWLGLSEAASAGRRRA